MLIGLTTTTLNISTILPPGPLQAREKVVPAVRETMDSVPVIDLVPLHPPPALQLSASVADQLRVVELPLSTLVSLALKDNAGVVALTATLTEA
jgi:hypothetical protein